MRTIAIITSGVMLTFLSLTFETQSIAGENLCQCSLEAGALKFEGVAPIEVFGPRSGKKTDCEKHCKDTKVLAEGVTKNSGADLNSKISCKDQKRELSNATVKALLGSDTINSQGGINLLLGACQ